jgi:uncharacterized Zn finger protein
MERIENGRMGTRLSAPPDGIVSSQRPRGWLGRSWLDLLDDYGSSYGRRVARGRSLARGRMRALWFSPGFADAEVHDKEIHRSTLRVRAYSESEWKKVLKILSKNLAHVATLMEGRMPEKLVEDLAAGGIDIMPTVEEISGDCSCSDYELPCAHLCGVHHVVGDAIDGEPFLLFTLRGRTREQIMSSLRRGWGDKVNMSVNETSVEPSLPEGSTDWFTSPAPLSHMQFRFHLSNRTAAGLRALGPPPGEDNLAGALGPLYEAGAEGAFQVALHEDPASQGSTSPNRKHKNAAGIVAHASRPLADPMATKNELTELLVNMLAKNGGIKSSDLAEVIGQDKMVVRNELIELEKLGIVYRTGATRGTRWHLG